MEKEFEVIILSESGDFMVEKEADIHRDSQGFEVENPWIINENEKAQQVQATEIFIPYNSIENVQYGNFNHETT